LRGSSGGNKKRTQIKVFSKGKTAEFLKIFLPQGFLEKVNPFKKYLS
jgi:hypothetical protein